MQPMLKPGRRGIAAARSRVARLALWAGTLMGLALLVPLFVVTTGHNKEPSTNVTAAPAAAVPADAPPYVRVQLGDSRQVERVALEQYVRGVVAAEMPASFELEALKAQAISARTYIVRRLSQGDAAGNDSDGTDVTDTITHQAYVSLDKLAAMEPDAVAKLNRAVNETVGLIVTYDNQPIEALYFSTSNGYTENVEDYYSAKRPYLRSVASPWDEKLSPRYEATVRMSLSALLDKVSTSSETQPVYQSVDSGSVSTATLASTLQRLAETEGKRIASLRVGNTEWSGRAFREKLGLASSDIQWSWDEGKQEVVFTTRGYGHGVGMSQYGAQGMALDGDTADEILTYYYKGVKISAIKDTLPNLLALSNTQ